MSAYKAEQHRFLLHGRDLHFVSYEGTPANAKHGQDAIPAMWYLMSEGKRHPVMLHVVGQNPEELDRELRHWAEENAFGPVASGVMRTRLGRHSADLRTRDWWGAN